MYSKKLRGAKRRAQNLGVTEAPLEQIFEEGGNMISGGGEGQNPKKCHFTSKKRKNLELGRGSRAAPPCVRACNAEHGSRIHSEFFQVSSKLESVFTAFDQDRIHCHEDRKEVKNISKTMSHLVEEIKQKRDELSPQQVYCIYRSPNCSVTHGPPND